MVSVTCRLRLLGAEALASYHEGMDLYADLLPLLPWWVGWAVPLATVFLAFGSSWLFTRLALLMAVRGFDPEAHWTQRARLAYASRVVSGLLLVVLPAAWGIFAYTLGSPLFALSAVVLSVCGLAASFTGVLLAHHASLQAFLPHPPTMRELLASIASLLLVYHPLWLLLLIFAILGPSDPTGAPALVWATGLVIGCIMVVRGDTLHLARLFGLARKADHRLQRIAEQEAADAGRPPPDTWILRWKSVNALAFTNGGRVVFSDHAVALLDEDELAALAAHEIAHIGEPPSAKALRLLSVLPFLPLAALVPLVRSGALLPVLVVMAFPLLAAPLFRRFRRRMEERADRHAGSRSGDAGGYAAALARLYELNAMPAVGPPDQPHPDLYDRLIAAGRPPDYPRPEPPPAKRAARLAGGAIFSTLMLLSGLVILPETIAVELREGDRGSILIALALTAGASEIGTLAEVEDDHDEAIVMHRAAVELARSPHEEFVERSRLIARLAEAGRCHEAVPLYLELSSGTIHDVEEQDFVLDALSVCDPPFRIKAAKLSPRVSRRGRGT